MSMEKLDEATTKSVDGPPAQRWLALALMVGGWALYGATMAPGLLFGDSGELQFALPIGGLIHPTGYPLFGAPGWLRAPATPLRPRPATRVQALSVLGGGGVHVTYDTS